MPRVLRELRVMVVVLSALLLAADVMAQGGSTAQISGTVRDESGGVLPGADVTATQTETGVTRSVVTDAKHPLGGRGHGKQPKKSQCQGRNVDQTTVHRFSARCEDAYRAVV